MKYYLKRFDDGGWEYSPYMKDVPREGFEIVNELPDDIVLASQGLFMQKSEIAVLKERIDALEAKIVEKVR